MDQFSISPAGHLTESGKEMIKQEASQTGHDTPLSLLPGLAGVLYGEGASSLLLLARRTLCRSLYNLWYCSVDREADTA